MPGKARTPTRATATQGKKAIGGEVASALASLKRHSTRATLAGMARYGLPTDRALGVTMSSMKMLAKQLGRNHALAAALWKTGVFEARMLATLIDEPARVTAVQMDRWCRDFDNWGICDTACFALFDRTAQAWEMVPKWARERDEFVKRAAFALLWSLSVHDKDAPDAAFLRGLKLIERGAGDERHWVKKSVNMALRAIGKRNRVLHTAAVAVARRLAESDRPAPRWVGRDALREFSSASVHARLARRVR